jgi:hypothetical protein
MAFVRITSGEEKKAGITIGSIFKAKPYWLDPREKYTLEEKISGPGPKYKPNTMNHYRCDLEIIPLAERISLGLIEPS